MTAPTVNPPPEDNDQTTTNYGPFDGHDEFRAQSDSRGQSEANGPSGIPNTALPFGGEFAQREQLRRPFSGRMLAGVATGVARYFRIDVNVVRIGFAVLAVFGPGVPLYLAGLLLIPDEGSDISLAGSLIESIRTRSQH